MTTSSSHEAPESVTAPTVSVILAVLNERENLPLLFDRLFIAPLPSFEVVVVDDGSSDGTREFLTDRARTEPRLRLIWHDGKQTTVRAQCQGIAASRGEIVLVMDADLQHPPEVLPAMARAIDAGAGLVVGSRYATGGSAGHRSRMRGMISRGAEVTAKLFLREARGLSDPVSGLFGFRRELFRPLDPRWRGYKLLLFLLVMARDQRVVEVGYQFEERGSGASKVTQDTRFIRFFLTELLLAKRLEDALRRPNALPPSPNPDAR